jgi:hypothetical protein
MADWLVRNAESTKVDLQHKQVRIRIRRTLGIKEGDRLVLLAAPGIQPTFTHVATVNRIRMFQEEDVRLYNVEVDDWSALDRQVARDEFRYSLTIVRNLERPYLHFLRGYRLLPESDYEAIVRGEPFLARSAYMELFLALPNSLQRTFRAENLALETERAPYAERLRALFLFLDERVLEVGRLLREIGDSWHQLSALEDQGFSLRPYFVDEDHEKVPYDILAQAKVFEDLQKELSPSVAPEREQEGESLFSLITQELQTESRRQSEGIFEEAFKGVS